MTRRYRVDIERSNQWAACQYFVTRSAAVYAAERLAEDGENARVVDTLDIETTVWVSTANSIR